MQTQTPTETAKQAAESPISVVESFLHAFEVKDMELVEKLLADDVVYQNVPLPADHGKKAVLRTLRNFERFITDFQVRIKNIAEKDGTVLTERVDILSGPFVYLDIWVCGTFEVKNGKITLWRDYFDLAECTGKLIAGPFRKLLRRTH
jgi:limonene-1,2-epoxide hydrolase